METGGGVCRHCLYYCTLGNKTSMMMSFTEPNISFSPCVSACRTLDTVAHKHHSADVICRLQAPEMAVLAETTYHNRDTLCLPGTPSRKKTILTCATSCLLSRAQDTPMLSGAATVVGRWASRASKLMLVGMLPGDTMRTRNVMRSCAISDSIHQFSKVHRKRESIL